MPIRWDSKILLAKIEGTYATDSAPAGNANAVLATRVDFQPMEGQDISRELDLPWLAAQSTIAAGLFSRMRFRVELVPSGTAGTAPAWGPLLRACAVAQTIVADTSVTYNPISEGHESLTLHFWVGGTRYVIIGARGSCVMRFDAQGIAYLEFSFEGLFAAPSEQSRPTPVFTAYKKPKVVSKANTPAFSVGGVNLVMRAFALDLGNTLAQRLLVPSESIIIENRAEVITTTVEAVPLTTFDPYAKRLGDDTVAVALTHGTVAGSIAALAVAAAEVQRPASLENRNSQVEWPLRLIPQPTTGNDQWTLTLT